MKEILVENIGNLQERDYIKKGDNVYKIIDIDNEYIHSVFTMKNIKTKENEIFNDVDLTKIYILIK